MELIDDHPVVRYLVRFRDRTEISEEQAAAVKDGNIIVWVVRTHCLPPSYHSTAKDSEERYRFNIQAVEAAVPVEGEARDAALAFVEHGAAQGYLNLGAETYPTLFDPSGYGSSVKETAYDQVAALLDETGYLEEGESVYDAVLRLITPPAPAPAEEPQLPFNAEPMPVQTYQPSPAAYSLEPGSVEIVDRIYRDGPSADRRLIEEMFGNGAP